MLRAQQAAKRAVAARSSLQQVANRSSAGRRVRRWRSDQIAASNVNPTLRTFATKTRQSDEHMRRFFDTLRTFSTAMPRQLVRVNGDSQPPPPRSWREAAALQGYRAKDSTWGWPAKDSAGKAAAAEESDLDRKEDAVTKYFPEEVFPRPASPEVRTELATEMEVQEEVKMAQEEVTETAPEELQMIQEEGLNEKEPVSSVDIHVPNPTTTEEENRAIQELEAKMINALKKRRPETAMELFASVTDQMRDGLSSEVVRKLFQFVSKHHPFHAYQILQYILQRRNVNLSNFADSQMDVQELGLLYREMSQSLHQLDPTLYKHGDIRSLVGRVAEEIRVLPEEVQKICMPELVTSLVMQKSREIGGWARHYYNKVAKWELDLPATYYRHLLAHSKYNRQDDLPFYDALRRTVQGGLRPYPHVVLGVVENMFPYNGNIKGTHVALESVVELQTKTQTLMREQEEEISRIHKRMTEIKSGGGSNEEFQELQQALVALQPPHSYVMNILSLEQMADAATKKNMVQLVLSVWDALDVMGLEPSEAIYESTILCFAQNPGLMENAFAVLHDMEEVFPPSLAFITAFGMTLSKDRSALQRADHLVDSFRRRESGAVQCTPTSFNVLIAAHAWRGYVERCFDLLDAFRDQDWSPDAYSFAFALESVGKAAKRVVLNRNSKPIHPRKKEALIEFYFESAESILTRVEETRDQYGNPVIPTHHFVRQYVELLCTLGEATTAGLVAQDFMEQTERGQLVCNKTLWRVASAHAENGNIDLARQFGASTSEALPFMEHKLDNWEEHHNNLPDYEMAGIENDNLEPLGMVSLASDSEAAVLTDDGPSQLP